MKWISRKPPKLEAQVRFLMGPPHCSAAPSGIPIEIFQPAVVRRSCDFSNPHEQNSVRAFFVRTLSDYTNDAKIALRISDEEAASFAKNQLDSMLKDGLHTPNNFFYAISDSSSTEIFGHLWVLVRERGSEKSLFIADIFVDEKFRGRNIGTETLNWCDKQARELGCASVSLHVFEHNTKAFKLYERMGFNSVSIQMRKMV